MGTRGSAAAGPLAGVDHTVEGQLQGSVSVTLVGEYFDYKTEVRFGYLPAPNDGHLQIFPFHLVQLIPRWPTDEYAPTFPIVDDPGLAGHTLHLQALVGSTLLGPNSQASWTNLAVLAIQ
jgi:hypothetical protein